MSYILNLFTVILFKLTNLETYSLHTSYMSHVSILRKRIFIDKKVSII